MREVSKSSFFLLELDKGFRGGFDADWWSCDAERSAVELGGSGGGGGCRGSDGGCGIECELEHITVACGVGAVYGLTQSVDQLLVVHG